MTVQRVESAAAMFTTPIILELELLRLLWTAGPPSTSLKTYGAPRLQGDWRDRQLISLHQRIRPRGTFLTAKMEIRALRSS
jgi:hypothetical protein